MDLNGDGHRDILSGSYSESYKEKEKENETDGEASAGLFQVLYGQPAGKFRAAEVLKGTDGKPLVIPQGSDNSCTRPFAVDWDGDGHLDLIVGNYSGGFFWFHGEGKGKFQPKPEVLKTGNEPLQVSGDHSDPFVIDWDGDGDLDILSGSSEGGVQLAENTAGAGKVPQMKPFKELIKPGPPRVQDGELLSEDELKGPSKITRVCAADVNRDGKLDLLVGDFVILISTAKGVTRDEFKKKHADWKKAFENAEKAMNDETDNKKQIKAMEKYREIYDQRKDFMTEEMTGFVWLYLQK